LRTNSTPVSSVAKPKGEVVAHIPVAIQ